MAGREEAILLHLQDNAANKRCADCEAEDPEWGVINRGIMVCTKCSGTHQSFGTHLSKVCSILDKEIWTNRELISLMVKIGNENSNKFWEHHNKSSSRLRADVESEIRENFIQAKYVSRAWIPMSTVDNKDTLSNLLCETVATDDLMRTIELIALGANTCHLLVDVDDPEKSTPLAIARSSNQLLQAKLLELNGASICQKEDHITKKGHLYKAGTNHTGWQRRYCSLDQHKGFEYFKTETDSELQGHIRVEEMFSVAKSEDEGSRDSKYKHSFEVNTRGRGYLFCADTAEELEIWVGTFKKIISCDNLGYDKVGYLKKKDPHSVSGWQSRWFMLKGKSLACYKKEREELDEIDLWKVMELKGAEPGSTPDQQCILQIIMDDKTYHLKAESPTEAESWLSALRHTQVYGIPLGEQQLTSTGIPIVIHKCLQFIESIGRDEKDLYIINGEKPKITKLILAFKQDARGVVIDPEKYTVHDVTGTLKQFLHSLPDPVLTHSLYQNFIAVIQSDHEAQMYQLKTLIDLLPPVNKETLKRIIGHLRKVIERESQSKVSISNIARLFGPTLMTVNDDPVMNDDPVSFVNIRGQFEYTCIHTMIKFYKWLFQVAEEELKKDEAIEEAVQKIKELEEVQRMRAEMKGHD